MLIRLYLTAFLLLACREHVSTTESTGVNSEVYLTMQGGRIAVKDASDNILPTAVHEISLVKLLNRNKFYNWGDNSPSKHWKVSVNDIKQIIYSFKKDDTVSTCLLINNSIPYKEKVDSYNCTPNSGDLVKFIKACKQRNGRIVNNSHDYFGSEVIWSSLSLPHNFACVFDREGVKDIAIPSYCFDQENIAKLKDYVGKSTIDDTITALFDSIVPKALAKSHNNKYAKCSQTRKERNYGRYFFSKQAADDSSDVVTRDTLLKDISVSFEYVTVDSEDTSWIETPFQVVVWCENSRTRTTVIENFNGDKTTKSLLDVVSGCSSTKYTEATKLSDLGKLSVFVSPGNEGAIYTAEFKLNPRDMIAAPAEAEVSWCNIHGGTWTVSSPNCSEGGRREDSEQRISVGLSSP